MLPTAPHKRGYHYHIQDKQPLPPLQLTPLPSALPSSRAFPQVPSPQKSRSTHIRYWTRQHPFTVPLGSSTPLLPTPAPNRKQCRPHFFACAAYNNMLTKSGTHRWLVQLFFLPHIMTSDATSYYIETPLYQPHAAFFSLRHLPSPDATTTSKVESGGIITTITHCC